MLVHKLNKHAKVTDFKLFDDEIVNQGTPSGLKLCRISTGEYFDTDK